MLALIRLLVTFGSDVIQLLTEVAGLIKKAGAGKDRKKAERIMYVAAWKRAMNITGRPPVPPRPQEQ